ncbi:MAG: ImmA/IrrE family metallo-endopeptidase, partial [Paracoccaceae bacterium]
MARQKLYAGVKLRETRTRLGFTQKDFAARLGVSLPYLNQMENNRRPVSAGVVLALAHEFGFDVTELSTGDSERIVADMREALADPVFGDAAPPLADMRLTASNAPALARAFLDLHRAYRQSEERLAALDERLGLDPGGRPLSPWEEVRDFFHYCDNYIDAVDRAAERFSHLLGSGGKSGMAAVCDHLAGLGVTTEIGAAAVLRQFDATAKTLRISATASPQTRHFQVLHQTALIEQRDLLEATLDLARFQSSEARSICKIGLANYFAGAALLPYALFLESAQETRHDLERLAARFGASLEQVAHRLSTLQRPGARGVPF